MHVRQIVYVEWRWKCRESGELFVVQWRSSRCASGNDSSCETAASAAVCEGTYRRTNRDAMPLWWSQSASRSLALSGANVVIRRRDAPTVLVPVLASARLGLGSVTPPARRQRTSFTSLKPVGGRRAWPIDNLAVAVAAGIFAVQMTRLSDDAGDIWRLVAELVLCRSRRSIVVVVVVVVAQRRRPVSITSSAHLLNSSAMTSRWRHHPASPTHFRLLSTLVGAGLPRSTAIDTGTDNSPVNNSSRGKETCL